MAKHLLQSKLFSRARKEAPADATAPSHVLLTRAGYIDQLGAGIFSLLPLGWRVNNKVADIVRDEMNKLGAQEITMPALQPASLWQESDRLEKIDPPLFRIKDRHDKDLVLASTHEEAVVDLARDIVSSYKDLPLSVFQIQTKFRNETRATGGLLRVREFQMKDLYSFHSTTESLQEFYEKVTEAYKAIFKRCDLTVHMATANSGTIGGKVSHEFQVEAESGEDKVEVCPKCGYIANAETLNEGSDKCPECETKMEVKACIENGHIFQLGTKYSEPMHANFTDADGSSKPLIMGCYGIGIGRLLATIAETHHDESGLKWPASVSPFHVHVLALQKSVIADAEEFIKQLPENVDVLFDDRDLSPGQKLSESDLLGITTKVVISEKNKQQGKVEIINRTTGERKLVAPEEAVKEL